MKIVIFFIFRELFMHPEIKISFDFDLQFSYEYGFNIF